MHPPACLWALLAICLLLIQTSVAIPLTEPAILGRPTKSLGKIDHVRLKSMVLISATPACRIILRTYASFLPLSLAASSLFTFYARLSASASGPWHYYPEVNRFTVHYGSIIISFQASHNYGIPWGFVAEFAAKMASVTERGFTGCFQGEYTHLGSGAVIRIGLRNVLVAAAA